GAARAVGVEEDRDGDGGLAVLVQGPAVEPAVVGLGAVGLGAVLGGAGLAADGVAGDPRVRAGAVLDHGLHDLAQFLGGGAGDGVAAGVLAAAVDRGAIVVGVLGDHLRGHDLPAVGDGGRDHGVLQDGLADLLLADAGLGAEGLL